MTCIKGVLIIAWMLFLTGVFIGLALPFEGGNQREVSSDVFRLVGCLLMALGQWVRIPR